MANTLLTLGGVTRRSLMVLENKLVATKFINREYDDRFAVGGAKIGASVTVRLPNQYLVTASIPFVDADTVEEGVIITINQQPHVSMNFTQQDYSLSIDEFSDRYIVPAMAELANYIDRLILAEYWNFYNTVGTPGTTPASTAGVPSTANLALFAYGQAMAKADFEAMPRDGNRSIIIEPTANIMLVSALSGLFQSSTAIADQYEQGTMGGNATFGAKFSMDQNIAVHTVGPLGGVPLVDGVPAQGATTLLTKGWTPAAAPRLTPAGGFTIGGVNSVNPRSRVSTGQLRQFVVTADVSSSAGGAVTIAIAPALQSTGAKQTVTALPADNAALTVLGAASTLTPQNLLLHKDAITLACVDMVDPSPYGVKASRVSSKKLGISMLCAQQYDINDTVIRTRIDVLFGIKTLRASMGVRVAG